MLAFRYLMFCKFAAFTVIATTCTARAAGNPYCGVYCAYSALRVSGSKVELHDILDKRYVSSLAGSTVENLCQLVRDHGAHPTPLTGLGESALRASTDPIILHVRRPGYRTEFAHWVLYLGVERGMARVLDPPGTAEVLPFAELLAVWDGLGIVVSNSEKSDLTVRVGGWLEEATILIVVSLALGSLRCLAPQTIRTKWFGAVAIPLCALVVTITFHACNPIGFLRAPSATGEVVRRYFEVTIPTASLDDIIALKTQPHTIVIDCRLEGDYRAGHIEGAINLPITANLAERMQILSKCSSDCRLVVYCQSQSCPWSKQIAGDLHYRGFRNVFVFVGGWVEWSDYALKRHNAAS